jgi:hypothetical protein
MASRRSLGRPKKLGIGWQSVDVVTFMDKCLTGLLINIRITGSFLSWPLIDSIKNTVPFKLVFHLSNWKYSNYSGRGVGGGCFRVATPNVDDIVKVTIGAIASLCEIGAASATSTLSSFVSRRFFCVRQYRV